MKSVRVSTSSWLGGTVLAAAAFAACQGYIGSAGGGSGSGGGSSGGGAAPGTSASGVPGQVLPGGLPPGPNTTLARRN